MATDLFSSQQDIVGRRGEPTHAPRQHSLHMPTANCSQQDEMPLQVLVAGIVLLANGMAAT